MGKDRKDYRSNLITYSDFEGGTKYYVTCMGPSIGCMAETKRYPIIDTLCDGCPLRTSSTPTTTPSE